MFCSDVCCAEDRALWLGWLSAEWVLVASSSSRARFAARVSRFMLAKTALAERSGVSAAEPEQKSSDVSALSYLLW